MCSDVPMASLVVTGDFLQQQCVRRIRMLKQFLGCFAVMVFVSFSFGHEGHDHGAHHKKDKKGATVLTSAPVAPTVLQEVDGQGNWKFRYRSDLSKVPVDPSVLHQAHGGLVVNKGLANGQNQTYFALPGVGLIEVSDDLQTMKVIGGSREIFNPNKEPGAPLWNYHDTAIIKNGDELHLGLPSDNANLIWIVKPDGTLVNTFSAPPGASGVRPTTLLQVPNSQVIKVTYGYGDKVTYEADPFSGEIGMGVWNENKFGGAGVYDKLGLFSTPHHTELFPTGSHMVIADREHGRFQHMSFDGQLVEPKVWDLKVPNSKVTDLLHPDPCGIDFSPQGDIAVIGNLKGNKGEAVSILDTRNNQYTSTDRPATFQILDVKTGIVLSTVSPYKLGVPDSHHIHSSVIRYVDDRGIFVICLFWNPGGYAVFERIQE